MYPDNMGYLYSNFTPRKSKMDGVNSVVVFGIQYLVKEYLIKSFNNNFFNRPWESVKTEYCKHTGLSVNQIKHIEELHKLGYLPIEVKSLEEGVLCPVGVPCITINNTVPQFAWLVNYLETLFSTVLWKGMTSATIANEFRKLAEMYSLKTTGNIDGVQWQCHDFSMRGMSSVESAIMSGMGHLTSFTGTDTVPAIYALEDYYNAEGLIGASVPASEHSILSAGQKEGELQTFERILNIFPEGILSMVSDTWNLWDVLDIYLPKIKDQIMSRNGKLVIRPDSGNPADIICGDENATIESAKIGVIEKLWNVFGGVINEKGYKVLDSHVGCIYGDGINIDRAEEIFERLGNKGFASTNIVLGVGSYTYQFNTRDTFGFAMKATYCEVNGEPREIFKDPITDDGTKKSKKGLLKVYDDNGYIMVKDSCTREEESESMLETVFIDGKLIKETNLETIRKNIKWS
jgi:nicotinamide phosphoribosyltransferase